MEEKALQFVTYYEKQREIADRFRTVRKSMKVSQTRLSVISGVSYASIRRFENTGEISLVSLIKLALALQRYDDIDNLFKITKTYSSIEDVINEHKN